VGSTSRSTALVRCVRRWPEVCRSPARCRPTGRRSRSSPRTGTRRRSRISARCSCAAATASRRATRSRKRDLPVFPSTTSPTSTSESAPVTGRRTWTPSRCSRRGLHPLRRRPRRRPLPLRRLTPRLPPFRLLPRPPSRRRSLSRLRPLPLRLRPSLRRPTRAPSRRPPLLFTRRYPSRSRRLREKERGRRSRPPRERVPPRLQQLRSEAGVARVARRRRRPETV